MKLEDLISEVGALIPTVNTSTKNVRIKVRKKQTQAQIDLQEAFDRFNILRKYDYRYRKEAK